MRYHSEDSLSDFRPYLFPIFMQRYGKILRKRNIMNVLSGDCRSCFYRLHSVLIPFKQRLNGVLIHEEVCD